MTPAKAYLILASIMLVNLLSTAGIALPYPILAPLFMDPIGSGLTQFWGLPPKLLLAFALAVYPFGMLIGASVIGALSDLYGRKATLVVTLGLTVMGYLATAFAIAAESYGLFILARLATGIFEGNISVARAIAADLHPTIDKTRAFSWLYAMTYAGWLVGPLTGGYMMTLGADAAFYLAAVTVAASAALVKWLIPSDSRKAPEGSNLWQSTLAHNSFRLLKTKPVRRVFVFYLLLTMGLNAFYEFYPLWLVETHDFDSVAIGHITAVQTLAMVFVSLLLVEWFSKALGKLATMLLVIALLCAALMLLPWLPGVWVWAYFALTGALIAAYNGLLPVYITDHFHELPQGQLLGLLTSTFCLANAIVALLAGPLSLLGAKWSIFFGGVLIMVGAALFMRFNQRYVELKPIAVAQEP